MASASATNSDLSAAFTRCLGAIVCDIGRVFACEGLLTGNAHCPNPDQQGNFCAGKQTIAACLMCVNSRVRAYVDISQRQTIDNADAADDVQRGSLKAELDFLDDSFLDELKAVEEADSYQGEENWIELREVDGQLDFLKGRGVVFYSREERLEYSSG